MYPNRTTWIRACAIVTVSKERCCLIWVHQTFLNLILYRKKRKSNVLVVRVLPPSLLAKRFSNTFYKIRLKLNPKFTFIDPGHFSYILTSTLLNVLLPCETKSKLETTTDQIRTRQGPSRPIRNFVALNRLKRAGRMLSVAPSRILIPMPLSRTSSYQQLVP